MEDKIQELTRRLFEEGVEKARLESEDLRTSAHKEAEEIVNAAQAQAQAILDQARAESEALREQTLREIQKAGNQLLDGLRQQVSNLILLKSLREPLEQSFEDQGFLRELIRKILERWDASADTAPDLRLLLSEQESRELEQYIREQARHWMKGGLDIAPDSRVHQGFRIGPADGQFVVSFTASDFENLFRQYLRQQTASILFGQ